MSIGVNGLVAWGVKVGVNARLFGGTCWAADVVALVVLGGGREHGIIRSGHGRISDGVLSQTEGEWSRHGMKRQDGRM